MMYETAIILRPDHTEGALDEVKSTLSAVITENGGEVMLEDDWGMKTFAWPIKKGLTRGHYLYFIYKTGPKANLELERRFNISEDVVRTLIVKLGPEAKMKDKVKEYTSPFQA